MGRAFYWSHVASSLLAYAMGACWYGFATRGRIEFMIIEGMSALALCGTLTALGAMAFRKKGQAESILLGISVVSIFLLRMLTPTIIAI